MGWVTPAARSAAKKGAKYGARYGPHALVAWELAGSQIQALAKAKLDELAVRRKAFDHADSTRDGSVLRVVDHGLAVFVVYAGEEPVATYPETGAALADLVRNADLAKRQTPEDHRQQLLRARARRAGSKITRGRVKPPPTSTQAGELEE